MNLNNDDNLFIEDSRHDYERHNKDEEYVKNLRKVDVLNSQLKRKKISKWKYNREFKKIKHSKEKELGNNVKVPKTGTETINLNRPNKDKPWSDPSGYANNSDKEKFKHYYEILKRTENYNDYKIAFKNMAKFIGKPDACTITVNKHAVDKGVIDASGNYQKKSANCTSNTKLYHTSRQKGLTRLSGKFRSSDNSFYSSKRVYFFKDGPGNRYGIWKKDYSPNEGEYIYEYIGDPTKAYIDPEIKGNAVFIETDTSVPVKDVTSQFVNKRIQESFKGGSIKMDGDMKIEAAERQYNTFKERYNYDIDSKTIEVNGDKIPCNFIIGNKNKFVDGKAFIEKTVNPSNNKKSNNEIINIVPFTSAGKITFSMDKGNVQSTLGQSKGKPKKYTDSYEDFNVYYDKTGIVDSVEFWDGNVKLAGLDVFKSKYPDIKKAVEGKDPQAIITKNSITSKKLGVIIKANGLKCKSIMAVRKDYFDPE